MNLETSIEKETLLLNVLSKMEMSCSADELSMIPLHCGTLSKQPHSSLSIYCFSF